MSDLISRQDAIEAVAVYIHNVDKVFSEGNLSMNDCVDAARSILDELPSAQPDLCDGCDRYGASCVGEGCGKLEISEVAKDTNVPANDCISRQAAIDALDTIESEVADGEGFQYAKWREYFCDLPSTQPEPMSESYMKAVWTWLLDYQIKTAELKGRYTPYEVLSWVANDWRKEHE